MVTLCAQHNMEWKPPIRGSDWTCRRKNNPQFGNPRETNPGIRPCQTRIWQKVTCSGIPWASKVNMSIRIDDNLPDSALQFLKRCYKFVNQEWQHAVRELLPDQGFEQRFRESCVIHLSEWSISPEREMHLGDGLVTASGLYHEIDVVARTSDLTAILEIKNRQGLHPEKNDVIIFFAKILDYLAFNPSLLLKEICPAFMSNAPFEQSGLAACLGLGIHPIAPELRPLPILVDNARRMKFELKKGGISVTPDVSEKFWDFCAQLNNLSSVLKEIWLTSRCGFQSEDTIVLRAVGGLQTPALSQELRQLNGDCTELLGEFRRAKSQV